MSIIEEKEEEEEEEEEICSICIDDFKDKTKTFVCNHLFCQKCLVDWNASCINKNLVITCPICRKQDIEQTNQWNM